MSIKKGLLNHLGLFVAIGLFLPWFWIPFYEVLNADHVMHVLMAEHFDLSRDLYYWGQDRLGSWIPIVSQVFLWIGLTPFYAVAMVQLLLLVAIYFLWAGYLKNPLIKGLWALVLFLPIFPFQVQVLPGHPYLGQFFFMGCFLRVFSANSQPSLRALALPLLAGLAIWCSELVLPFFAVFALLYPTKIWAVLKTKPWHALVSTIAVVLFLVYAKNHATDVREYSTLLASPADIWSVFRLHAQDVFNFLIFKTNKPFNAILVYSLILATALLLAINWKTLARKRLFHLFFFGALISYLAINLSHWSALMGRPYHHYVAPYLLLIFSLFYAADNTERKLGHLAIPSLFGLAHVLAALVFINHFPLKLNDQLSLEQSKRLISKFEKQKPSAELGLIASYWNSYLPDALTEKIVSLPHEGAYVRDFRVKDELFNQNYIVLIRNQWRADLPSQIEQHGYLLKKTSKNFQLDEIEYAFYKVAD